MLIVTEPTEQDQLFDVDDSIVHWPCCHDYDTAMCGASLVGHADVADDVDCADCIKLYKAELAVDDGMCVCLCCMLEQ
jgi:hypothetical protein